MRIDVFTQVPHAFGWLTEQKPLATVLGARARAAAPELPRHDAPPCRAGRRRPVRRRRGHGAARRRRGRGARGRLRRRRGPSRIVALTPQGRQLDQRARRGARRASRSSPSSRRGSRASTSGSSRTSAPMPSRSGRTCSRAASCPRWCCVDAIARRLPGALAEGSGELESFSAELEGGIEYPHYTRPAAYRGWEVPDVLLSGRPRRGSSVAARAEPARSVG